MKYLIFGIAIWSLALVSCHNEAKTRETRKDSIVKITTIATTKTIVTSNPANDKQEIQTLIRKVLNEHSIDLLPAIFNRQDSLCTGFDMGILKQNMEKLKASNLFSATFIENYKQIILTLDKKIKNKEFSPWHTGELPTFIFANDVDPWTLCQDVPYDEPNALDYVEVTPAKLNGDRGEWMWKWGNLPKGQNSGWRDFSYKFNVEKENGVWKVSYMQGFDFKESTHKDGL
ncbi:hypothetical protein [Mucilaginibacter sp. UYCu711]|uniref:hypothetical protein n=1 Tax=Mucilaginibacter sp. UYCu711 TaxID=3156339 RepID=UPI003D1BBF53